jgi:RNA polymerase sigma-70 factor (ECF subfamily)
LAERFERERPRLRAIAYRMLGSVTEAEDAVQEAWLRLSGASEVDDLGAWLTTVVARLALNTLRSRKRRSETHLPDVLIDREDGTSPEHAALLADSLGLALLVVLEKLPPAERVAFVLHDIFGLSFEAIAPIVERAPDAARQLASRGRRRVQARTSTPDADPEMQRSVVEAFLAASRDGDLPRLIAVLAPDVILRSEKLEIRGAEEVARRASSFSRSGIVRHSVLVNGVVGALCFLDGKVFSVAAFTVRGGKIVELDIIRQPTLRRAE